MSRTILFGSILVAAAALACDPVYSDKLDAIPPDPSGQRNGPLHRPGQECGLCHDGSLGGPPEFSLAGTIYQADGVTPAWGASINFTDRTGHSWPGDDSLQANEAGNFYVTPREYTPRYPITVAIKYNNVTTLMASLIGRGGSCAECHSATKPPGPKTPGVVYATENGVTP